MGRKGMIALLVCLVASAFAFEGCKTAHVAVKEDSTDVYTFQKKDSLVEQIGEWFSRVDTSHTEILVQTIHYDTSVTDSDGTHPVASVTNITARKSSGSVQKKETSKEAVETSQVQEDHTIHYNIEGTIDEEAKTPICVLFKKVVFVLVVICIIAMMPFIKVFIEKYGPKLKK